MGFDDVLVLAALIATGFVLLLYLMAAQGSFLESRFGRAVFYSAACSLGVWFFFREVAPNVPSDFGVSFSDLALYLIGLVLVVGAGAAFFDLVGWLRGEWRTPPPPFE